MKRYLAIVVLIGLVIWGIYDVSRSNSNIPQTTAENPAPNDTGTNNNLAKETSLEVGIGKDNLAPDFELLTPDGKALKLSDFKGKKVILNFWATWCPPCKLEMPYMEEYYKDYQRKGVEILAVNLIKSEKSRTDVPDFIKDYGLTFPVVLDEENSVSRMYQVSSIPTSYIINSRGVIQEKVIGPMNYEIMEDILSKID